MMQHRRRTAPGLLLVLLLLTAAAVLNEAFVVRPHHQQQQRQRVMAAAAAGGGEGAPRRLPRDMRGGQQQQQQQQLDRASVLQLLGVGLGVGMGGLVGLGGQQPPLMMMVGVPAAGAAELAAEEMMVSYDSPSKVFSFDYPDSWALAPKPLQTHQEEVNVKSTSVKGFSAGVAVDPVRIQSVAEAGSPAEVGGRIVALEGKKEGVGKVELLDSAADGAYYAFDYAVESTRGKNRYLARATVVDRKLVVFTVQVPIAGFAEQERVINNMLASFRAPPPK